MGFSAVSSSVPSCEVAATHHTKRASKYERNAANRNYSWGFLERSSLLAIANIILDFRFWILTGLSRG